MLPVNSPQKAMAATAEESNCHLTFDGNIGLASQTSGPVIPSSSSISSTASSTRRNFRAVCAKSGCVMGMSGCIVFSDARTKRADQR